MALERWLLARWFGTPGVLWLLWPLECLYRLLVRLRGAASGVPPVPVIVVGNLAIGGSGKTPLVIALVEALRRQGLRPGVVSRGYGGRGPHPLRVQHDTAAAAAGDEPLLIARRCAVPVVVDPRRDRALQRLLAEGVDVVVSDDGLQHRRLPRSVEIVVIDGRRGLGNGHCLPVGPLREPVTRLASVDFVVCNGEDCLSVVPSPVPMRLLPGALRRVDGAGETLDVATFQARCGKRVAAFAGIGDPERFFVALERAGFQVERHPRPDHHVYADADFHGLAGRPVLMTEKDAVKCAGPAARTGIDAWYLPVDAQLPDSFIAGVLQRAGLSAEKS